MDGKNLELIAHNFRTTTNVVNSFGEIWLSDNDDDGNQQIFSLRDAWRGLRLPPRGPARATGTRSNPASCTTPTHRLGSPTGICFYEGTLLPKKY